MRRNFHSLIVIVTTIRKHALARQWYICLSRSKNCLFSAVVVANHYCNVRSIFAFIWHVK